uniref:Uncharacterized protein n=1 Tax=Ditylenchus dipsaci TaxID=166011 RepID=A0A915CP75_9BILA
MEMTRASLRSKLDCKYRKSCYQDQQIGQQEDESEEVEDKEEKIPSQKLRLLIKLMQPHTPLESTRQTGLQIQRILLLYSWWCICPMQHKNATDTFANDSPAKEPIRVVYDGNGPACNTYSSKYYLSCHPKLG